MGIMEKIGRFVGGDTPDDDLPDDITRDKFLRSLRRQRRVQLEEVEKQRLQKQIKQFEMQKTRKQIFGIGDKPLDPKNNMLRQKFKKEAFMFKTEKGPNKSMLFKKTKMK